MPKKLFAVLLLILLTSAYAAPRSSAISINLPHLSKKGVAVIDRMFQTAVNGTEIAGAVVAVFSKKQIIYFNSFGKQNASQNIPMSKDTIFRMASMTKPFTCAAIMLLYEQGKLKLDDPASKYLPSLKNREVIAAFNEKEGTYTTRPAAREITVRDLLAHTAGYGYAFTSRTLSTIQEKTGKDELDLPLLFDPGTRWHYSPGTAALGEIVEKISGQSLEEFFQKNIFRPLKMSDTSFYLSEEKAKRLVTIHQREAENLTENPNPQKFKPNIKGDGGLFSTAADYSKFLQMLLNNGTWNGIHILKPETVRLMTSNQIGSLSVEKMPTTLPMIADSFLLGGNSDKFGLGFEIAVQNPEATNERSSGSYAWAGLFNTYFWVDPKKEIGAVFLAQELPFSNPANRKVLKRFENLIYENLE